MWQYFGGVSFSSGDVHDTSLQRQPRSVNTEHRIPQGRQPGRPSWDHGLCSVRLCVWNGSRSSLEWRLWSVYGTGTTIN